MNHRGGWLSFYTRHNRCIIHVQSKAQILSHGNDYYSLTMFHFLLKALNCHDLFILLARSLSPRAHVLPMRHGASFLHIDDFVLCYVYKCYLPTRMNPLFISYLGACKPCNRNLLAPNNLCLLNCPDPLNNLVPSMS